MVAALVSKLLEFKREQSDEGNDFESDLAKLYYELRTAVPRKQKFMNIYEVKDESKFSDLHPQQPHSGLTLQPYLVALHFSFANSLG